MKLQQRSKDAPEINMTSLIDVVLLLIIFFMVSTTFNREAEINIRLPEANAQAQPSLESDVL
jgi:biopolymer transport protein ExbD